MWKIPRTFSTEKGVNNATNAIFATSFVPVMMTSLKKVLRKMVPNMNRMDPMFVMICLVVKSGTVDRKLSPYECGGMLSACLMLCY